MKKKILVMILASALVASMLTACGKSKDSSADTDTTEASAAEETKDDSTEIVGELVEEDMDIDDIGAAVDQEVQDALDEMTEAKDALLDDVGDSEAGYEKHKDDVDDWYDACISKSKVVYDDMEEWFKEYYKLLAEKYDVKTDSEEIDAAMEDGYNIWNDALTTYYDGWSGLFDNCLTKYQNILTYGSDEYSTMYTTYNDKYSELYQLHSDCWSKMYYNHQYVALGFDSGDDDVTALLAKAKLARDNDVEDAEKQKEEDEAQVAANTTTTTDTKTDTGSSSSSSSSSDSSSGSSSGSDSGSSSSGSSSSGSSSSGTVSSSFKSQMDGYSSSISGFVSFMQQYQNSYDEEGMQDQYNYYMSQYNDTMTKLNSVDVNSLSQADANYYYSTYNSINNMLGEVAN